MITDYTSLQASVISELNRSDLAGSVPAFIQRGEWRIARDARIAPMLASVPLTITAGTAVTLMPATYMEVVSAKIQGTADALTFTPAADIYRESGTGTPWLYTMIGQSMMVAPRPLSNVVLDLVVYQKLPELSAAAPSNFLVINAPDVLLYAALLESAPKLRDDKRIPVWKGYYDQAITALNRQYGAALR